MKTFERRRPGALIIGSALAAAIRCGGEGASQPVPTGVPSSRAPLAAPAAHASLAPAYAKDYTFSYDWFTHHIPVWTSVLAPYRGRPGVEYLEVGVFEGRSALWVLENVLTHPTAGLTVVDLFDDPAVKKRWLANLEKSGRARQAVTVTGYSQAELRRLPLGRYDIIYVDGSHRADDVMADAVLCWWLLKEDGLLIFDDYQWRGAMSPGQPTWPAELGPGLAIDAFVTAFSGSLEVVHRRYQFIVRKRPDACGPDRSPCSVIGRYRYWWGPHTLTDPSGQSVRLSREERWMIETIARTKSYGDVAVKVPEAFRTDPGFLELKQRLGLDL